MIRAAVFWAGLALVLGAINLQIASEQAILNEGRTVLLRLRHPPGLNAASGPPELRFGAESFAFEEGQADAYQRAAYGILRVAEDGDSVLVGLAGEDRRPISPDDGANGP